MSEVVSISVGSGGAGPDAGEVVVTAPRTLAGWEEVEVTLRAEGFPPTFRLAASSGIPTGKDAALAHAGDSCTVALGDDKVITGYLTSLTAQYDSRAHEVELIGAGKTQDLIGEIEWDQSKTYLQPTIASIETIAGYFGIGVSVGAGAGDPVPGAPIDIANYPIVIDFGRSAGDYISEIARLLGVLVYEDASGDLKLSRAGTETAASGVKFGSNVQAMSIVNSMQDRFSEIVGTRFRDNQFLLGESNDTVFFYRASDPEVPRRRVRHVFNENGPNSDAFTMRMADWEVARRAARSRQVRVTVDSWRDSAGKLWAPNTIVPLDVPGLAPGAGSFGLSEVTFRRNGSSGTTADMVLIPIKGFTPEPIQPTSANLIGVTGNTADAPGQQ